LVTYGDGAWTYHPGYSSGPLYWPKKVKNWLF
jgi:hypothetical protein